MKNYKKIGIISGAGPYAGLVLHQKIINYYNNLGYYNDNDFPLINHISYPFSCLTEQGVVDIPKAIKEVNEVYDSLESMDMILMACNSLFPYLKNRKKVIDTREVLNEYLRKQQINEVFILASKSSIKSGVYQCLEAKKIYPDDNTQEEVTKIIKNVMQGVDSLEQLVQLTKKINKDVPIILGCTELCVYEDIPGTINLFNLLVNHI